MRALAMRLATSALAAGCGRIAFEPRTVEDGALPDAGRDAAMACDSMAAFGAPVPIAELNSPERDGTLRLLPDERSGYFWSDRDGTGEADIYLVTRPDLATPFAIAPVIGLELDTNEMDPGISPDGTAIVFRRSGPGNDLWFANRVAPDTFTGAVSIASLNTASDEVQSFLQAPGDVLYFGSDRDGDEDLYRTTRTGTTFATPPEPIAELATADSEGDPALTFDGLTIYFRSDRPAPGFATFNIWSASRGDVAEPFGPATLVANINSDGEDGPSWVSPDGCRLYLSSDRAGSNDVYVASRGE